MRRSHKPLDGAEAGVTGSVFMDARRKLVVGTEVLRTGGGATLTAGDCSAVLDRLADLVRALELASRWIAVLPDGRPDAQATCAYVPRHVHDSIEEPLL